MNARRAGPVRSNVGDCGRHRPLLAELAARTCGGARSAPLETPDGALDAARLHLERCESCRSETEALALVSFAVRRAWDAPPDLEPSPESWSRLRARVTRRGARLGWSASSVVGLALGTALTIGLIVPIGTGMGTRLGSDERLVLGETGYAALPPAAPRTPDERDERAWLIRQARERLVVQVVQVEQEPAPQVVRGPVLPRREQMRYTEREPRGPQTPPAVPPMTIL